MLVYLESWMVRMVGSSSENIEILRSIRWVVGPFTDIFLACLQYISWLSMNAIFRFHYLLQIRYLEAAVSDASGSLPLSSVLALVACVCNTSAMWPCCSVRGHTRICKSEHLYGQFWQNGGAICSSNTSFLCIRLFMTHCSVKHLSQIILTSISWSAQQQHLSPLQWILALLHTLTASSSWKQRYSYRTEPPVCTLDIDWWCPLCRFQTWHQLALASTATTTEMQLIILVLNDTLVIGKEALKMSLSLQLQGFHSVCFTGYVLSEILPCLLVMQAAHKQLL